MKRTFNFFKSAFSIALVLGVTSIKAQTTQCVTDGGFEAGIGAGTWTESSTNFGTPLCDLASCGTGTGTGPHNGSTYWAWFGGFPGGVEQSELSQSVTIPTGSVSADLTFWLEQIVCDGPTDYMVIKMDNDTIFTTDGTSALCAVLGYAQQTVSVLTYADGLPHTLSFSSTTFSVNAGPTNFFVDDVSILATGPGGGGPDCADTLTFTPALAITDGDLNGVTDAQTVSGITGTLGSTVSLIGVHLAVTHTWVGDLTFTLTAPNGTVITLYDRPGVPASTYGCDGDNLDMMFVRGTGNDVEAVCGVGIPTISGIFTATNGQDLDAINTAGGSANGTWSLFAFDAATPDSGTIDTWSLIFSTGPVASWNAPDTICATAGSINLAPLVTGTAGGTFTGTGVTGSTFDPTGLSGPIAITYAVSDVGGCVDSSTQNIVVINGLPVPSFTANVNGNTVSFTNTSTNATSYSWSFGDGGTDNTASPTHNYGSSGTFNVTLFAANICGIDSVVQSVTTGCVPDTIVVNDGGFEAGIGAGTWTESSTNFGTPLCDVASCGTGGGTGPYNGSTIWAWFGGTTALEQAEVSQPVLIPVGTATLAFYLEQANCDDPVDYLDVIIDTDTVFATNGGSPLCGVVGYSLQTADVSALADGNTHTLLFSSTTFGTNAGVTNFFVDDISIGVCTSTGITEAISGASIEVNPNPASDYINLQFKNVKGASTVSIMNSLGQEVYNNKFENTGTLDYKIDISKWSAGVYTVKLNAYHQEFTKKLVVK